MSGLSFSEVGEILSLLQSIEDADVDLEWGDLRIQVRRASSAAPSVTEPASLARRQHPATSDETASGVDVATTEHTAQDDAVPPVSSPSESAIPDHWVAVTAPMAGTFYRSPNPDESPFVEVGDTVSPGQTVALIEVMKLFTELKTDVPGKVARIDASDGELVEFGQCLVWIEPA